MAVTVPDAVMSRPEQGYHVELLCSLDVEHSGKLLEQTACRFVAEGELAVVLDVNPALGRLPARLLAYLDIFPVNDLADGAKVNRPRFAVHSLAGSLDDKIPVTVLLDNCALWPLYGLYFIWNL